MLVRQFFATLFAAALLILPMTAHAELKVGCLDTERVLAETDAGKAALAKYNKWYETAMRSLTQDQDQLKADKDTLDRQSSSLSLPELTKRQNAIQARLFQLQLRGSQLLTEATERRRVELAAIDGRIDAVLATLSKELGMSMIFDKRSSGLRFALSSLDVTNEVIRRLNASPKTP